MDRSIMSSLATEQELREDLAAAFRIAARYGWHESVANHFSAAVSADGKQFLLNPRWQHFSTVKASDLLLLDADDPDVMSRPDAPDPSAWCIHGAIHRNLPHGRVLLHLHPTYATALMGLKDPTLKPIDQCTARYYNRVAVDTGFDGIADDNAEGERLAKCFGNHSTMLMGNHGVITAAQTVAQAFDDLYYLERACQTMVLAYSTGQELAEMDHETATKTAQGWDGYQGMGDAHFAYWKSVLDREEPDYRD